MQKDAIFRIMSMTKPVVALAILMLVEEGKVRLTDPVAKFIPELQTLKVVVPNTGGLSAPRLRARCRRRCRRARYAAARRSPSAISSPTPPG